MEKEWLSVISIVCVYDNEKSLNEYLLNSLKVQTSAHETIFLDNTQGQYKSAAEALNLGAFRATGKYIMFVHQDVDLCSTSWLEEAEDILDSIPHLGIAGVAGMSEDGRSNKERGRNIIEHRINRKSWEWGNPIEKPEQVQTVDGCLMIVPKTVFDMLSFDERTCDDWHLYEVDYCLSCAERGLGVYAIPMFIYHRSGGGFFRENKLKTLLSLGPLPDTYYRTLKKLRVKHRKHYKTIYTTCGDWNLSYPVLLQRIVLLGRDGLRYLFESARSIGKK